MEPFVTVIAPVRNEERYIERCLYSIARQDYPRDRIEVLVVDGRSDDRTREIVARFAAESTLDVRLLDNPARKPAAAMNIGLGGARGDVIVRIDGHAALAPDYLRRATAALEASGADCVGGVLQSEGDTYIGRAVAAAMSSRFGVGGATFRTGGAGGPVDTVAFGAYRRGVFQQMGRFREDIDSGEDDEFNYRLRDAGGVILLLPELRATYTVRDSIRALWRQYLRYGVAKPSVLRLHPGQARPRHLAAPAFVFAIVASSALAVAGRAAPLRLLVAVYGAAALAASAMASRLRGARLFPVLPAVFACMHVAYGTGFLAGLGRLLRGTVLGGRGVGLSARTDEARREIE
jgi:glycosyltransferase involved in cell wall biosynthesis